MSKYRYIPPSKLLIINLAILTAIGIIFIRPYLTLNDYIMIEAGGALSAVFILSLITTRRIRQFHMEPEDVDKLILEGPYSIVRHPHYTGIISLNIAYILFFRTVWLIPVVVAFIILWYREAKHEETILKGKFELEYLSYMEAKGMFLPRLKKFDTRDR